MGWDMPGEWQRKALLVSGFCRPCDRLSPMRRFRAPVLALLGYLALSLLLTWPLALHLTTHAPGNGSDDPAIIWNLWWVRYSLTVLRQNPFHSDFMFWPLGVNLVFYTLTVLNALLSIPLQLSVGLIPANSAVIFFELGIGGLGMYLLADWLLARHNELWHLPRATRQGVAFLAGATFTFASSKFVYLSLGQFNIAASHWVPWTILAIAQLWAAPDRRRQYRAAVPAALFLLFNGWTEFTYASFLLIFILLFWVWHVLAGDAPPCRDGPVGRLSWALDVTGAHLLLGALFLLGMSPILWQMLADMRVEGDFLVEGLGFANVFSNDLLGFITPSRLHPLFGPELAEKTHFAYLNFAFLGWTVLVLVAVALVGRSRHIARFWAVAGGLFMLLSLGPTLRINGREFELPLPFDLLLQLPFFKANRYPSRYSVMIALCLAVLVAYGLATFMARLSRRNRSDLSLTLPQTTALLLVLAMTLFETLSVPLPMSDFRVPAIYNDIAGGSGAAVLEVPVAWRNGFRVTGTLDPTFMFAQFYQTVHEKRIANGNTSRNPELKFQYFTEAPLFNRLIALETGHSLPPDEWQADVAATDFDLLGADYVVVHKIGSTDPVVAPEATIPFLESTLPLTKVYEDPRLVVFRRNAPHRRPATLQLDAGHPNLRLMLGEGWSAIPPVGWRQPAGLDFVPLLWIQRQQARLFLPLPPDRNLHLTARLYVPAPGQRLRIATQRGELPGSPQSLPAGWNQIELSLPARLIDPTLTELRLEFSTLFDAARLDLTHTSMAPPASIGTTGVTSPVPVVVESAGQEVGDFAHIYVNGTDVAHNTIGYNLAVINPTDGTMIGTAAFDIANDPFAADALTAFLDHVPAGFIVAVAANDTVTIPPELGGKLPLDEKVVAALATIGATGNLQGTFRWSHAILGVKAAPPGTAAEDFSATRPARVWAGPLLNEPRVAAAVAWLRIRAQ